MSALAAIHVGLKQLGIEGEDARDVYERVTGARSLRAMNPKQHEAVIGELRRLGFVPKSETKGKRLEGKFAPKLQALWIAAWNLGVTKSRSDSALIAFAKRQTGIDHVRFLRHGEDANKVIEALKGWLAREAGVDWNVTQLTPDWQRLPGYRVARAQFKLLLDGEPGFDFASLTHWLIRHDFPPGPKMEPAQWVDAMNLLGAKVRGLKKSNKGRG